MDYPKIDELDRDYIELRNDLDRVKSRCDEIIEMMEQLLDVIKSLNLQNYERRKKTGRRAS